MQISANGLAIEVTPEYRTCCTSIAISKFSLGRIAMPATQLAGMSKPPCSAKRPA